MKPCTTCGNEIDEAAARCPYCESPQAPARGRKRRPPRVATVNLESGRPTAAEAVTRMETELMAARNLGTKVVRLIHGWGSSGSGGRIRAAVRSRLAQLRSRGLIRAFVPGEDWPDLSAGGADLLSRYADLEAALRTDRHNPGITMVEL